MYRCNGFLYGSNNAFLSTDLRGLSRSFNVMQSNELCKDMSTNPFTNPNLYLGNEAKAEEYFLHDWERMKLIQTLKSNNRVQDKNNFSVWKNESILECIFAYPIWSSYKTCDMHFINRHIWEIHLHKEKSWYWYFQH